MWDRLAEHVGVELEQLDRLLGTYEPLVQRCDTTPPDAIELAALAAMLHAFYNARGHEPNCLDVLNGREVPTRCADNRMWAVAVNSSASYSYWGSFVARPDATIAMTLPKNRAGMLLYGWAGELSPGGWMHNSKPMRIHPKEVFRLGEPSRHPRQLDRQAEP